jgi:hypothetical protein
LKDKDYQHATLPLRVLPFPVFAGEIADTLRKVLANIKKKIFF